MRNLSDAPGSRTSLLGVNTGASASSTDKAPGGDEEVTTETGVTPRYDEEVEAWIAAKEASLTEDVMADSEVSPMTEGLTTTQSMTEEV